MVWNDFTITVVAISSCVIVNEICCAVIELYKNKNK